MLIHITSTDLYTIQTLNSLLSQKHSVANICKTGTLRDLFARLAKIISNYSAS